MYTPKDYKYLLGLKGFSDLALNTHFTLYEGYVKNINGILEKLMKGGVERNSIEASELERRMGWEYNGMKLHEIYFESLSNNPREIDTESNLYKKIVEIYGSFENWIETFKSIALMRGIGWIAPVKGEKEDELFTVWIDEHNTGNLTNSKIIFIMDVFEHAFLIDFNTKKADYINAFFENVDWKIIEDRF